MIESIPEFIARIEAIPELKGRLAYDHFATAQQLPFACYTYAFDTGGADSKQLMTWDDVTLELYSETRNFDLEQKILQALDDVEITSDSDYIDDERMYMTSFSFQFPHKYADIK